MIEDLIQQIHLCRSAAQLDDFYTQVKSGYCSGYYSMNCAIRAINEINHRLYSDHYIVTPKPWLFFCSSEPTPVLDLNFSLGSYTAVVGPTPIFSRASSATYVDENGIIQTASSNSPRIDYDPGTLLCRGLLMEPTATNEFSYSDLSSGWSVAGLTISTAGTSPADSTAIKLTESATTAAHFTYSSEITTGSGAVRVFSIYAKADERSVIGVAFSNAGDKGIFVNLINGRKVGNVVSAPDSYHIENAGNGWWRISISQNGSGNGYPFLLISNTPSATDRIVYSGDGSSGLYVYGAQCETNILTSLIQTSGSPATRTADICNISGSDFSDIWDLSGSTILVEFETSHADEFAAIVGVHTTGYFETCVLFKISPDFGSLGNHLQVQSYSDGFAPVTQDLGAGHNTKTLEKCAIAVRVDETRISLNGATVVSASTPTILPEELFIGQRDGSYGAIMRMRRLRVFESTLSDSDLQTFTTTNLAIENGNILSTESGVDFIL
jgi:hypothetical protein